MEILYVALSAFGGGIASAVAGWLDSGEYFEGRKFMSSLIRALVAGAVFAIGYTIVGGVTIMDICIAFCAGAGVDVLGNRVAGSIRK
uniref:Holin n=1 Tax=viral metagenome TaxID=1070528 RepID=A0A6M3LJY8_9ZZZZ